MKIGIIDYEVGNLKSVRNALNSFGANCIVSSNPAELVLCDGLILPGDGAAKAGINNLKKLGLDIFIKEQITTKPFLGICLGMQILLNYSEEGNVTCLSVVEGNVKKIKTKYKVPQIGWNQVEIVKKSKILNNIKNNSYFYFINSYICSLKDKKITIGKTDYGETFCSVFEKNNIFGIQFHPEKSGEAGKQILKNYLKEVYENNSGN